MLQTLLSVPILARTSSHCLEVLQDPFQGQVEEKVEGLRRV